MRKVTEGLLSSTDGVVRAPDQWQSAFDDEMGAALSRMLEEQDAVLLGRVAFTEWAQHWPTSTDEPFASWINSTPRRFDLADAQPTSSGAVIATYRPVR